MLSPDSLIHWLSQYPSEVLSLGLFGLCAILMLVMMRAFGAVGLIAFTCVALIAANIQVMTASYFSYFHAPVALGTVVFSSLFLCSDILNEYYGAAYAKKSVWVSFSAVLMLTMIMLLTLAYLPASGGAYSHFSAAHKAIATLFTPVPAIMAASLIAYVVAQFNDIGIFSFLSKLTSGRFLWLRTVVSTLIGAFVDNLVFSVLAWMVFAPKPLAWDTVFYSYVMGTYMIRVCVAFAGIPLLYVARAFVRK